jgi:hypothetical protein
VLFGGKTLYTDINLTTAKTGFIYVEETVSNHVYNLNTSTGVVGSDTGIVCGSGTSGTYKLGIDITTVCGNTNSTLYTSGAFNVGDVLYTDVNLTIAADRVHLCNPSRKQPCISSGYLEQALSEVTRELFAEVAQAERIRWVMF